MPESNIDLVKSQCDCLETNDSLFQRTHEIVVDSSQAVFIIALNGGAHISCVCYCLNLTIHQAITLIPSFKLTLDASRKLVTHFKRSGIQSSILTNTLKKDAETYWNSVVVNKNKVVGVLTEREEEPWLGFIEFTILEDLCGVMMPLKLASEESSADKLSKLHLVLPFIKIFKVSAASSFSSALKIRNRKICFCL